jgi:hypothetical protein
MGTNLLSSDLGYRVVVVALAVAGTGMAAVWLRRFPPDFGLVVWTVRGLLCVAIVVATISGATVSTIAVLVAALATFGATVIRFEPIDRLALLAAVALVSSGGGLITDAISPPPGVTANGSWLSAILGGFLVLVGVVAMWAGRSFVDTVAYVLRDLLQIAPIQVAAFAAVLVILGTGIMTRGAFLLGLASILAGVGVGGVLAGHVRRRDAHVGLGSLVVGAAGIMMAAAAVADGDVLFGYAAAGTGVVFVSAGAIFLQRRGVLSRLRHRLETARR